MRRPCGTIAALSPPLRCRQECKTKSQSQYGCVLTHDTGTSGGSGCNVVLSRSAADWPSGSLSRPACSRARAAPLAFPRLGRSLLPSRQSLLLAPLPPPPSECGYTVLDRAGRQAKWQGALPSRAPSLRIGSIALICCFAGGHFIRGTGNFGAVRQPGSSKGGPPAARAKYAP